MIQIDLRWVLNIEQANTILRTYPKEYPKRTIMNASLIANDMGWFLSITYELKDW